MLSITIDLVRNYATASDEYWDPGCDQRDASGLEAWSTTQAIASAEEMLHLYNELGLAYYNIGAVQDALSVWDLAFDWQRAIAMIDADQGKMYAGTLAFSPRYGLSTTRPHAARQQFL